MSISNPELILPEGRMMHASCIVENAAGEPRLLVIGGKTGNHLNEAAFSNSVIGFDLKTIYEPWLQDKSGEKWVQLNNMQSARANFAFTVVDNLVYVFGGVGGIGNTPESVHIPQLVSNMCERYDPKLDKWETIKIENSFPLGAFGWTVLDSPEKIMIVGGTDGDMLQENCWIVDFKTQKA